MSKNARKRRAKGVVPPRPRNALVAPTLMEDLAALTTPTGTWSPTTRGMEGEVWAYSADQDMVVKVNLIKDKTPEEEGGPPQTLEDMTIFDLISDLAGGTTLVDQVGLQVPAHILTKDGWMFWDANPQPETPPAPPAPRGEPQEPARESAPSDG